MRSPQSTKETDTLASLDPHFLKPDSQDLQAIKKFYKSLDRWRILLAETIIKSSKNLTISELNSAVQNLLDRLIFLRVAEACSIEPQNYLKVAIDGEKQSYYQNLLHLFDDASSKYNLELFDLTKDRWISTLTIDNRIIEVILTQLYNLQTCDRFIILSIEILSGVYERFLGKQIIINTSHKAQIVSKNQVKKTDGIYYTPEYIVRYIVENTIGKIVEKKTPIDVEKIRIVDPACGSGIFLLGAFDYLLHWHQNYYVQNSTVDNWGRENSPLTIAGNLTLIEKKRILLNNIYGIDLDQNAVEVTKRSLLLRCLECSVEVTVNPQTPLVKEFITLMLDDNFKSGNALIDYDYYDKQTNNEDKIKPFSWEQAFPGILQQGGFDAVIGNPPYVRNTELDISSKNYFIKKYFSAYKQFDLYLLFNELALKIAKIHGIIGYIQPSKFISSDYGLALTNLLVRNTKIESINNVSLDKIFDKISVYPYVFIFRKKSFDISRVELKNNSLFDYCPQENLIGFDFLLAQLSLQKKIIDNSIKLQDILIFVSRGVPNSKIKINPHGKYLAIKSSFLNTPYTFCIPSDKSISIDYINANYGMQKAREFQEPLILIPRTTLKIRAILKDSLEHIGDRIYYLKLHPSPLYSQKFILGILNSSLISFIYAVSFGSTKVNGGYFDIRGSQLKQLPIPKLDLSQKKYQKKHQEMIILVDKLILLNGQKLTLRPKLNQLEPLNQLIYLEQLNQIQEQINYCESRVNELVYSMYGLKEEEIKIIEGREC